MLQQILLAKTSEQEKACQSQEISRWNVGGCGEGAAREQYCKKSIIPNIDFVTLCFLQRNQNQCLE